MVDTLDSGVFDKDGYPKCPYCRDINNCEHLLLFVDITFRNAEGGELSELFNSLWWSISEESETNPDFNEAESFHLLLQEVGDLSDDELDWDGFDTAPGMSSAFQIFWCKDGAKIKEAINKFKNLLN